MDKRRLVKWLSAPLVLAAGLVMYGTVFGRISSAPTAFYGAEREVKRSPATLGDVEDGLPAVASLSLPAAPATSSGGRPALASGSPVVATSGGPKAREYTGSDVQALVGSGMPILRRLADHRLGGLSVPGATDYRDPAENGAVPLADVREVAEVRVSEHFRVVDFAAKDGAPFARISPELVELMEDLRAHLNSEIHINSAYRHPALNFNARIDGSVESRHMAGLAADIWVEGKTPFEVASAIVDIRGCRVGLGLGAHYVHVDLRDYAASWAYEDAEMKEADFDLWMLDQCEEFFGERARVLIRQSACTQPLDGFEAVAAYRPDMLALASRYRERRIRGAVLLDARKLADSDHRDDGIAFLQSDSPLLRLMRLEQMVRRAEQNDNFVFVLVDLDGTHRTGLMRFDGSDLGWKDAEEQWDARSDSSQAGGAPSQRTDSHACVDGVTALNS